MPDPREWRRWNAQTHKRRGLRKALVRGPVSHAADSYASLNAHGAIGDGRSAALVCLDGSVDWWCPGRFDGPSVFASLLDARAGGRFRVAPVEPSRAWQRYRTDTNVLETMHRVPGGSIRVTDFLVPPALSGIEDAVLVRRVACVEGVVAVDVELSPRFQYGRVQPRFVDLPQGMLVRGAGESMMLTGVKLARRGPGVRAATPTLHAGETLELVLRHSTFDAPVPFAKPLRLPPALLELAVADADRAWARKTRFGGKDAPLVRRAALVLRLLQHASSGAIVAAATTSLPEQVGGVRNWDYRFAWLRDGALCARALRDLGHLDDAHAFRGWLQRIVEADAHSTRIMYTVTGSSELPERVLPHLEGYARSAPVRIGNEAALQRQLDVYGEVLDFLHATADPLDDAAWRAASTLAQVVMATWREPDSGIWEMRSEPRHFVLSKAMAWAALDRAARFAEARGEGAQAAVWWAEAAAVRQETLDKGYDHALGAFTQAFGVPLLDASNLLLPLIGFIDARDPRMIATVERTMEGLMVDGLLYRYLHTDDGLPAGEATFTYCTFWLVEVLAMQGRVREAREVFEGLVERASPLGLFAEELEPFTARQLGNFPQGFPHAGLVSAAVALARAEGGATALAAPIAPPPQAAPDAAAAR